VICLPNLQLWSLLGILCGADSPGRPQLSLNNPLADATGPEQELVPDWMKDIDLFDSNLVHT
jgi:hypothetical protein